MWYQKDKPRQSESFWGWLMGQDKASESLSGDARAQQVRLRIIITLKQRGLADPSPLISRVASCHDLPSLWYLRPEIMMALSSLHGEVQARSIMTEHITPMFAGQLPKALFRSARNAPISH